MGERMTVKEMCAATGRTEYWLRNRMCAWCDADAVVALRWGCRSMYGDLKGGPACDPIERFRERHPDDNKE